MLGECALNEIFSALFFRQEVVLDETAFNQTLRLIGKKLNILKKKRTKHGFFFLKYETMK